MSESLHVELRDTLGKRHARRMRRRGQIPAVLYGHGEANLSLTIACDELAARMRHHTRVFALKGAADGDAFLRQVQYDPFGVEVLHVDLTRVSADEAIRVVVSITLKGDAPGTHHGGKVEHVTHEVELLCPVVAIPDHLILNVATLELGHALTAAALELPPGATLETPADTVIATCHLPADATDDAALAGGTAEPEIIGRVAKEGEEEGKPSTK